MKYRIGSELGSQYKCDFISEVYGLTLKQRHVLPPIQGLHGVSEKIQLQHHHSV